MKCGISGICLISKMTDNVKRYSVLFILFIKKVKYAASMLRHWYILSFWNITGLKGGLRKLGFAHDDAICELFILILFFFLFQICNILMEFLLDI